MMKWKVKYPYFYFQGSNINVICCTMFDCSIANQPISKISKRKCFHSQNLWMSPNLTDHYVFCRSSFFLFGSRINLRERKKSSWISLSIKLFILSSSTSLCCIFISWMLSKSIPPKDLNGYSLCWVYFWRGILIVVETFGSASKNNRHQ